MTQKSSTFIKETRERESWLTAAAEREGSNTKEAEGLLATAALFRGALEAVPVPDDAEEQSRQKAVAHMKQLHFERLQGARVPQAPWYLRLGRLMRFVFTFGRRR